MIVQNRDEIDFSFLTKFTKDIVYEVIIQYNLSSLDRCLNQEDQSYDWRHVKGILFRSRSELDQCIATNKVYI